MRYLGVDPGGKRLGLAVADDATGVVSPLEVIPYGGAEVAARRVVEAAERHRAGRVVIGLPSRSDGSEAPSGRRSRTIGLAVERLGLQVLFQPEFMSTQEARRRARAAGLSRDRPVDHLAAQIILEEFLASAAGAGQ